MIEVRNLSKKYRGKQAVDDLSFSVPSGKVTGFLGPNGAGKSTTMRLMLGLDRGRGTTLFDGRPLHAHDRPAAVAGILLEAKAFHPSRTARNHLRVLAAAGGFPDSRADEVLDEVGLAAVARKGPGTFSLGMAQRLGIAAALIGRPRHLILDEPANGLDPEGIVWLRNFVRDYAARGNAVFLSSHLLGEMARMADNVVVVGQGRLISDTTVDKLVGGGRPAVLVRVRAQAKLEKLLHKHLYKFKRAEGGLLIENVSTADVGRLAFEAGLPLIELTAHRPSLEESFLDTTAAAQEYKAT